MQLFVSTCQALWDIERAWALESNGEETAVHFFQSSAIVKKQLVQFSTAHPESQWSFTKATATDDRCVKFKEEHIGGGRIIASNHSVHKRKSVSNFQRRDIPMDMYIAVSGTEASEQEARRAVSEICGWAMARKLETTYGRAMGNVWRIDFLSPKDSVLALMVYCSLDFSNRTFVVDEFPEFSKSRVRTRVIVKNGVIDQSSMGFPKTGEENVKRPFPSNKYYLETRYGRA
ncbi:MAG: hypothetical protein U1E62_20100 [Alsobacter sp.]